MNRRDFLRNVALGALAVETGAVDRLDLAWAEDAVPLDPNLVALFSDIHLLEPEGETQQTKRFKACAAKVLAMNPRPATLLIYGDIVYDHGEPEFYRLFRQMIEPFEKAGIRWEVAMGNHDRIANYREAFPERFATERPLKDKCVNIVETPRADFIILDSYLKDKVDGAIDPEQREWLADTLKNYAAKPVFVGCHHPLFETKIHETLRLAPKLGGYIYGHRHYWDAHTDDGISAVCLPSVGHWGDMGFAMANVGETQTIVTPVIDAYLWSKWGARKQVAESDVDAYLKRLAEKTAVFDY